jgi:hypothetical protein
MGVQLGDILTALQRFQAGDLSVRLDEAGTGVEGEIARVINNITRSSETFSHEIDRMKDHSHELLLQESPRVRNTSDMGPFAKSAESLNRFIQDAQAPGAPLLVRYCSCYPSERNR